MLLDIRCNASFIVKLHDNQSIELFFLQINGCKTGVLDELLFIFK